MALAGFFLIFIKNQKNENNYTSIPLDGDGFIADRLFMGTAV
ncbi:hypothetical protein QW060_21435 [Myroides ceti]|uniref:Uncharacterized protein n=1 Tax=Paenimyroides ceti TaxID=395087 RepID=A0ABT8D248_9FLAO|nr:hypothetical protein [Paenimyroides ceti]MDN3708365.1 hypothetical protein [Paenimyroides ceti]MDN3709540.1 hypothetical protein [Paenimyroides ceti]